MQTAEILMCCRLDVWLFKEGLAYQDWKIIKIVDNFNNFNSFSVHFFSDLINSVNYNIQDGPKKPDCFLKV